MARKALKVSCERRQRRANNHFRSGVPITKSTRLYNRCQICGRRHGYLRDFGMCRICFRFLASNGEINGVRKSSW